MNLFYVTFVNWYGIIILLIILYYKIQSYDNNLKWDLLVTVVWL